jgi:hypothetical protein
MTKYSMYNSTKKEKPERNPIHPVWRGIGCILLIVIPVISYIAANYFITNRINYTWVTIPQQLMVSNLPDPFLLVKIFYTAIFVFCLYLILLVITVLVNRFFGPNRYGPYDVPLDQVNRK